MQPHQEGDLASFPVTPHADGLRALQHADSPLRLGEMPENANHKDFIRKGNSLHIDPESQLQISTRRRGRAPPPRTFGTAFSENSHEAARQLRREIRRGVKAGAIQRPEEEGAPGSGDDGDDGDDGSGAFSASPISLVTGPRAHAEVVLESEGVRGNLSGATALSRLLASRAGAPTSAAPDPEHHFYFGGTRAQKRRLARRAENAARAREANLALRKEELLGDNVQELQRMAREYEEEREAELRAVRAAEEARRRLEMDAARAAFDGMGYDDCDGDGARGDALAARMAVAATTGEGGTPSAAYSTPLAWAGFAAFGAALAGVLVYALRRRRGSRAARASR